MPDRNTILSDLLLFSKPADSLKLELSLLNWDYAGPPMIFFRYHLQNVLSRFLSNEIDKLELESWANLVECREDIEFENEYSDKLSHMIFQLANPELEGKLDFKKCKFMLDSLND